MPKSQVASIPNSNPKVVNTLLNSTPKEGVKYCCICGTKYTQGWCPECRSLLYTTEPTRMSSYRLCYNDYIENRKRKGITENMSFDAYRKITPFKEIEEMLAQLDTYQEG